MKSATTIHPRWNLSGEPTQNRLRSRIALTSTPFTVGRGSAHNLLLPFPGVSSTHARLVQREGQLWVEDLDSTNGTWVNGLRIDVLTQLVEGDVVQFGEAAFRVEVDGDPQRAGHSDTERILGAEPEVVAQAQRIDHLVRERSVRTLLQPLIRFGDGKIVAYECLARGNLEGLSQQPEDLFALAALRHRESELSAVCREIALFEVEPLLRSRRQRGEPTLQIHSNVHPREPDDREFLNHLGRLRERYPEIQVTLEIHERSIDQPERAKDLLDELRGLGFRVAFDDFGAGLARLSELAACPPDVLKFDRALVGMLSSEQHRMTQMMKRLVEMAGELGCQTVATGIETVDQFAICRAIGFELAQGFSIGRPTEVSTLG